MPALLDVLSVHRPRNHVPARRNCHVFLPAATPKLSKEKLASLQQPFAEREILREAMRRVETAKQLATGASGHGMGVSHSMPAMLPSSVTGSPSPCLR